MLYLDTARIGLMSPMARMVHQEFAQLSGDPEGVAYIREMLKDGYEGLPDQLQAKLPGLRVWPGIAGLQESLRRYSGAKADWPLVFSSRTQALMRFAARVLLQRCSHVLTVDLAWPPYLRVLNAMSRAARKPLTVLPLREEVLRQQLSAQDIVDRLVTTALAKQCDGLFLPHVSSEGVRLPLREAVNAIRLRRELRWVVVDGAQALGHVPIDLSTEFCDFYVCGGHKWLGGHLPLGIGFVASEASRHLFQKQTLLNRINDPLSRFCRELLGEGSCDVQETVQVASLLACSGAIADHLNSNSCSGKLGGLISAAALLERIARAAGWNSLVPDDGLRSGIILVQRPGQTRPRADTLVTRSMLRQCGIVATCYENGSLRLSALRRPMCDAEREQVQWGLQAALASTPESITQLHAA